MLRIHFLEKPTTAPLSTTKKATTTTTTELLLSTISTTEKEEGSKPPKQSRPPTTGKSTGGKWKTSDVFHSTETSVTTKPLPGTPGPIEKEEDGTNIGIIVGILVSLLIAIIMVAVVGKDASIFTKLRDALLKVRLDYMS